MKIADFKNHQITRTCTVEHKDYRAYKPDLMRDFQCRCCYCDLDQGMITAPFHIDHYIPEKAFTGVRESLKTDYANLMLACPKCNLAKRDQFEGNLLLEKPTNELFYKPDETDYNSIFFRNELGGIDSGDPKGLEMIKRLRLYRPIHNLAWLVEKLENICDSLEEQIKSASDNQKRKRLEALAGQISRIHLQKERLLRSAYLQISPLPSD